MLRGRGRSGAGSLECMERHELKLDKTSHAAPARQRLQNVAASRTRGLCNNLLTACACLLGARMRTGRRLLTQLCHAS